jgi:hypothetical protein
MVRMREALYGNYLQRTCDRPDDSASPSGRGSQTGKIFSENLGILVAQLSIWTTHVHRPDGLCPVKGMLRSMANMDMTCKPSPRVKQVWVKKDETIHPLRGSGLT